MGVGELVRVGVVVGSSAGFFVGTGVADAAGAGAADDKATAVVASRCRPEGEAAGTVGRLVNVGDGLDDGLGTGLAVRLVTAGGSA